MKFTRFLFFAQGRDSAGKRAGLYVGPVGATCVARPRARCWNPKPRPAGCRPVPGRHLVCVLQSRGARRHGRCHRSRVLTDPTPQSPRVAVYL